jgi:hypothetical protein
LTDDSVRENEAANARRRAFGQASDGAIQSLELLAEIENKNCTRSWMKALATKSISEKAKPALGRQEQRQKMPLVCSFAENCQELLIPARPVLTIPILPMIPNQAGDRAAFDDHFDGNEPWLDVELSDSTEANEDDYLCGSLGKNTQDSSTPLYKKTCSAESPAGQRACHLRLHLPTIT